MPKPAESPAGPADESICLAPLTTITAALDARQISSRELLDLFARRVERVNPAVNAVVTLDLERAAEAAAGADRIRAAGTGGGPLLGVPTTIKDAIEVAGVRSTGGATALSGHVPSADAPAVGRLRRAGAVVFGKTNVPEWSGDVQTYNSIFGTTRNPWDPERTPGGSSGGAAAAVASGLTPFEVGTDIGGSIRIPSHFCGVCGHKPSYGVVSQRGYLDRVGGGVTDADINVFGPIARSVADLELLLGVLAGPDEEDAPGWTLQLPPPRHRDLASYRIATWLDDPHCPVDRGVLGLLHAAADALRSAGAAVTDARPPVALAEADELFSALLLSAVSVSFEGEQAEALAGNHRTWLDHHYRRALMRRRWAEWFGETDILLCPVLPMPAFPHDQEGTFADRYVLVDGRSRNLATTMAWVGAVGVSYLPSTVVPVGRVGGLPVGIQVVGPYLGDLSTLFVAGALAELTGGYQPPPLAT